MKSAKCLIAVLVAAVVGNALDFYVQGSLLNNAYYAGMDSMRHDTKPVAYMVGDLVAVIVLAWVMKRLAGSFSPGLKGGAAAGFYLGVLANFPTYHFIHLMFKGYAYSLTWINTLYGVVWYVIAGAILGAIMNKGEDAPA